MSIEIILFLLLLYLNNICLMNPIQCFSAVFRTRKNLRDFLWRRRFFNKEILAMEITPLRSDRVVLMLTTPICQGFITLWRSQDLRSRELLRSGTRLTVDFDLLLRSR